MDAAKGRSEEYKGEIKSLKKMGDRAVRERLILHQSTFIPRRGGASGKMRGRKLTMNQEAVTLNSGQAVFSICRG